MAYRLLQDYGPTFNEFCLISGLNCCVTLGDTGLPHLLQHSVESIVDRNRLSLYAARVGSIHGKGGTGLVRACFAALVLFGVSASMGWNEIIMEPEVIQLPDDESFIGEVFSVELYSLIPHWGQAAEAYSVQAWDLFVKSYLFADAVLTREGHGTEGFISILVPNQPIPEESALVLGEVLASGSLPKPFDRTDEEITLEDEFSRLVLVLDGTGLVSEIRYLEWSP